MDGHAVIRACLRGMGYRMGSLVWGSANDVSESRRCQTGAGNAITLRRGRQSKRLSFVRFAVDGRSMFIFRLAKFLVEIPVLTDGPCDASNDDDRYEC